MLDYRFQIKTAVTWRIVAELMRRHQKNHPLWLLEIHPGGGQYDCISVYLQDDSFPGRHLCDFNRQSGRLHIFGVLGEPRLDLEELRWPEHKNYVAAFLNSKDPKKVIDQIEAVLGLPECAGLLPSTNPQVLAVRVIAGLLERYVFAREIVDVRSGWFDTSGMDESGVREELKIFPVAANKLEKIDHWRQQAMVSSEFWLINITRPGCTCEIKALIDMNGMVYFAGQPEKGWDIWAEYQNDPNLKNIVHEIDGRL